AWRDTARTAPCRGEAARVSRLRWLLVLAEPLDEGLRAASALGGGPKALPWRRILRCLVGRAVALCHSRVMRARRRRVARPVAHCQPGDYPAHADISLGPARPLPRRGRPRCAPFCSRPWHAAPALASGTCQRAARDSRRERFPDTPGHALAHLH